MFSVMADIKRMRAVPQDILYLLNCRQIEIFDRIFMDFLSVVTSCFCEMASGDNVLVGAVSPPLGKVPFF